jgi:hypothetical protein
MPMSIIERERIETCPPQPPPPETRKPTKRDVLHRAADLLEEFGWCQGEMGSKEAGALCLVSAVLNAHKDLHGTGLPDGPEDRGNLSPYGAYNAAYREIVGASWCFNDVANSKAEVVSKLREAAERT